MLMVITEIYGTIIAKKMIYWSIVFEIFNLTYSRIVTSFNLPHNYTNLLSPTFDKYIDNTISSTVSVTIIFSICVPMLVYAMSRLKLYTHGKYLYLRIITVFAGYFFINESIFMVLFKHLTGVQIKVIFTTLFASAVFAVILAPIAYILIKVMKRIDSIDIFEDIRFIDSYNLSSEIVYNEKQNKYKVKCK